MFVVFFFTQKTAYELRISDWSSDVCSSDLAAKVVVRKGRENYLCLLNLEDAAQGGAARPQDLVPLALIARWAGATRDGDLAGGDFPAWAVDPHGRARTVGLTAQPGDCIHAACPHYRNCSSGRACELPAKAHAGSPTPHHREGTRARER